jgi:GcrA cell cycle regulator
MSWTDERVELLSQLWLDGKSASQISAALGAGLTRNAVIGKVHRLGLAGRVKSGSPSGSPGGPSMSSHASSSGPRRAAPRGASSSGSAVASGAVASGGQPRAISGNNALALAPQMSAEVAPVRVAEDVVVPMSLKVTIVDLKESMCKWPLGDPSTGDFRYCGSPAPGATPYCAHHGKLAYQPMQDRRRERPREQQRTLIAR